MDGVKIKRTFQQEVNGDQPFGVGWCDAGGSAGNTLVLVMASAYV